MACYDNINGVLRKVDKIYDNVGGVLREVSRGYDNIGGTLREYHSGNLILYDRGDQCAANTGGWINLLPNLITFEPDYMKALSGRSRAVVTNNMVNVTGKKLLYLEVTRMSETHPQQDASALAYAFEKKLEFIDGRYVYLVDTTGGMVPAGTYIYTLDITRLSSVYVLLYLAPRYVEVRVNRVWAE